MATLSHPIEEITKSSYQIVVIGSGYGGSIAASRFARAGQGVCLLERGDEIVPGQYPANLKEAIKHTQVHTSEIADGSALAMMDFRFHEGMSVLVGCGLGGTSLINANVVIKPDNRLFDNPAWPSPFKDEYNDPDSLLNKGYALAEQMLKPSILPEKINLDKINGLEKSAKSLGQTFYRTKINVNFDIDGPNHVGVVQKPCNLCGDCCSGCNNHAKNTLLMNYLPDAKNHGAEIFSGATVSHIERKENRWLVHYHVTGSGESKFDSPGAFVAADLVVLAAGTLGSTEILLRSRERGLQMSAKLGNRFSGNGDVIGFGYNSNQEINGVGYGDKRVPDPPHTAGPCITSVIDIRNTPDVYDGMIIEDCVAPGAVSKIFPDMLAAASALVGKDEVKHDNLAKRFQRWIRSAKSIFFGAYRGAVKNTQTYLVMSHDKSAGRLFLKNNRLDIDYPNAGREEIFKEIDNKLRDATKAINGIYTKNPMWSKLMHNDLITVHPLGGCCMGASVDEGVINDKGQVFDGASKSSVYESLYVTDGSVIPVSLGVNPLITISAISERCVALAAKDRGWKIDYTLPSRKSQPKDVETVGIEFTEKMTGFFSFGTDNNDYQAAYDNGKETGNSIEFVLTIRSEDVHDMTSNPQHEAHMAGAVTAPGLSKHPLTVSGGVFNLFTDDPQDVNTKLMKYRMKLVTEDDQHYYFKGYKIIQHHSVLKMWHDTSTLYVTLFEGENDKGKIIGQGIMNIKPADFIKQMETVKVINSSSFIETARAEAAFGKYFAKSLFNEYGGIFIPDKYYDPAHHRKKRKLRLCPPEFHPFETEDGVALLLTRYNGGKKGPLLMVHGFSGNRLTFSIDTIDTNMAEYFYERGYDVWLFDYRLSNFMPSAKQQWTLDTIAKYDYPGALKVIKEVAKVDEIDVLGHCVGSITLFMALMNGMKGVRSVVAAQIATDIVAAPQTKWKAGLHSAQLMKALGIDTLSAYVDKNSDWENKLFDKFLKLYADPVAGVCNSPTCHRLTFMFGPLYEHSKLNDPTHTAQVEMFQVANVTSYEQLGKMFRAGKLLNAKGDDVYMPNFDLLQLPITFIHGEFNGVFNPESTLKTYERLVALFGDKNYQRFVIKDYGHNDCMYGKTADKDVFGHILSQFEIFYS